MLNLTTPSMWWIIERTMTCDSVNLNCITILIPWDVPLNTISQTLYPEKKHVYAYLLGETQFSRTHTLCISHCKEHSMLQQS